MVAGGVFEHFVTGITMELAEDWIGFDGEDGPAAGAEGRADREIVRAGGTDLDKDAGGLVGEEFLLDGLVDVLFCSHGFLGLGRWAEMCVRVGLSSR